MSKPRKDRPLKLPRYRGGKEALHRFIRRHLRYPEEALENKVEGTVKATYDVDGLGRVRNVRVTSGLGHGCDEEVIRLINLLVYEKATNPGRNVTAHKKLTVDFKLPEKKQQTTQVQYHLTPRQEKPKSKPKPQGVYTLSIKFKER